MATRSKTSGAVTCPLDYRTPWAPHTTLGKGRGCWNHKLGRKSCSFWHVAEGQARLIFSAICRKYTLFLAPTSCYDIGHDESHFTCLQSIKSANKHAGQGICWGPQGGSEAFPEIFSPGLNAIELRDAAPSMLVTPLGWYYLLQGCCTGDRHCLLHPLMLGHLPPLLGWATALSCSPGHSLLCGQYSFKVLPSSLACKSKVSEVWKRELTTSFIIVIEKLI